MEKILENRCKYYHVQIECIHFLNKLAKAVDNKDISEKTFAKCKENVGNVYENILETFTEKDERGENT